MSYVPDHEALFEREHDLAAIDRLLARRMGGGSPLAPQRRAVRVAFGDVAGRDHDPPQSVLIALARVQGDEGGMAHDVA